MSPSDSESTFASFVASQGIDLGACLPREGIEMMLRFYEQIEAAECSGQDADMLLYQWGTYDWGDGNRFELDVTRQFVVDSLEDDDAISQLSLTFSFVATDETHELGEGNYWCGSRSEIEAAREFIAESSAYRALWFKKDASITLRYEHV